MNVKFKKAKARKETKKEGETNQWKTLKALGPYIYIYIYIDNFIKTKLYIRELKINLMYKLYMVGFLCPPKVQID
mgnify:CR=1 FL=1